MIIIGGSSSTGLAKEVADLVGCRYIEAESTRFPDGECYTRIEAESLDDDVAIIQNTYPDGNMMEMFLLQDIVRGMGAKSVTLVIPYFGYARQDRLFKPGEPESAKVMCNLLDRVCDRVITIDIHKEAVLDHAPTATSRQRPQSPSTSVTRESTSSFPPTSVPQDVRRMWVTAWDCPTTTSRRPVSPELRSASSPPQWTAPERASSSSMT